MMKEFFKKVDAFKTAMAIVLIVFGLCLVCVPNATLLTICYFVGGVILLFGLLSVISYYIYGFEPFGFINGVCELAVGGLVIVFAPQITSPQVFSLIAGVIMLINGLLKLQNAMDCRRIGLKYWWLYMIYAVVIVTLSIVLLAYPFAGQRLFLIFLGIALIVDGILDLVSIFTIKGKIKNFKNKLNENVIEIDNSKDN